MSPLFFKKGRVSELSKRKIRTRLIVAIPIIIVLLVSTSGVLFLNVSERYLRSGEGLQDVNTLLKNLKVYLFVSVGASFLIGLILACAITSPINKLTLGAKDVAKGDLSKTVRINSEDEIGTLGKSFNEMLSSLNEHILESMTGGVITINMKGIVASFNTAAEAILGYDSEGVIGMGFRDVFAKDENNKDIVDTIDSAIKDKKTISSGETTITTKDKRKIPIGITTSLLKDKEDMLLGVVVTFKDLARIKHMEEQMRRADRLAALGSLAAGVAHEIRNPLGSVKGLAQLLREDMKEDDPKRGYTDVIVKEVDRLNKVVEELLSFARPEESHVEPNDINEIIEDTLQLAKHDASQAKIEIIRNYDSNLPNVSADSKKLQQAFLNIIFNAFHAMKEKGGQLSITTHLYEDPKFVEIRFQDTGPGIAPEHITRLFDPFFTTREDGTGLGLTITHQIIDSHGGRIAVGSGMGKGATFSVCLPR